MKIAEWALRIALLAVLIFASIEGVIRTRNEPAVMTTGSSFACLPWSRLTYQVKAGLPIRTYRLVRQRVNDTSHNEVVPEAVFQRTSQLDELICVVPPEAVRSGWVLHLQVMGEEPGASWRTVHTMTVR